MRVRTGLAAVACVLVSTIASAQALTSIASLRVGYNTRKTTVQPQGELKTQIDALDRDIAEATRLGRTGELRRLFAKGVTLLAGQPWTDVADYAASLVIRADRVVVDSSKPYFVRLEQIYSPSIPLERAGVRPAGVAVIGHQIRRSVRHRGIELLARRQPARKRVVVPAASPNPRALGV